ncbi:MAG: hypothetical protein K2X55_21455 [Burkholderiaceae bacterium]|nr:hypothetical protein [Burkholderiaceae bacterium]
MKNSLKTVTIEQIQTAVASAIGNLLTVDCSASVSSLQFDENPVRTLTGTGEAATL